MAHQTPKYQFTSDSESQDEIDMIDIPLCGLFSGSKKKEAKHNNCDETLDAIKFLPIPELRPRKKKSLETMQGIVDELYDAIDNLSLLRKFRDEVEDLQESKPEPEASAIEHDNRRLQDAVNLSALVITYWEDEWVSDCPAANEELPIMDVASRLMDDMIEGIQDDVAETWDSVAKISLHRVRLWIGMGGLDKNAPYAECYITEDPNQDGASDAKTTNNQQNRFRCNECPEAFEFAILLEDHLRLNHSGRGVGKWNGKTLRARIFGGLARRVLTKEKVENDQVEGGEELEPESKRDTPTSPCPPAESWLDVGPVLDEHQQPVQCPICSKQFTLMTALRQHYQSVHSERNTLERLVDLEQAKHGIRDREAPQVSGKGREKGREAEP